MKKLLLPILFLMLTLPAITQNLVSISGIITDTATGNPIPNHAVTISNDSSAGWFYYQTVYTNSYGFYVDTVPVPLNTQGTLFIRTVDCQNYWHQVAVTFLPSVLHFTVNFSICYSNNPCAAGFYSQQMQALAVQFTDASVGGGNIRQWIFGDGGTSTQMNPVHLYGQPGYYNVTLTIGALGTTCYNSMTQTIHVWDSIGGGCHAAFVAYPDSNALYSYQFWNQSTGNNIGMFTWNFGDGTTQTVAFPGNPNVSHVYVQPGNYLVCLTIQSNDSSCFDVTCDTLVVGTGGGGCNAAFLAVPDSMGPAHQYQFIDQSFGSQAIVTWLWDFGDPTSGTMNTSTLQNPVHIFNTPGTYNVCLTIYGAANCSDVSCMTIFVGSGPGCQAFFTYNTNPSTGNYTVNFTDMSSGNPTGWQWVFQPGFVSTLQNPTFTFGEPGIYPVCLTITGDSCSSTYCQNVVIQDSLNFHQVWGHVSAGNVPVSMGMVMIISLDTNANFQPIVEVTPLDSMGGYYFNLIPDGSYYILATPYDSNGYLPTYYGNVISWELATLVTLGTPNNPYNINLVPADQMTPGPGSTSGQINMGDMPTTMMDQVNMILKNAQGNAIGFTKVSTSGAFGFPTMAYGTYWLHPEMPGITSDNIMVVLTPEKPHANVVMTFTGNNILGIKDEPSLVNHWSVYPNPFSDNLTVSINMKQGTKAEAGIYNVTGQLVSTTQLTLHEGINTIGIPASSMPSGIYTLRIYSKDGLLFNTKLVKTR